MLCFGFVQLWLLCFSCMWFCSRLCHARPHCPCATSQGCPSLSVSPISPSCGSDRTLDCNVFKASGDELIPDAGDERKTASSQTRAVIINKSVGVCLDSSERHSIGGMRLCYCTAICSFVLLLNMRSPHHNNEPFIDPSWSRVQLHVCL